MDSDHIHMFRCFLLFKSKSVWMWLLFQYFSVCIDCDFSNIAVCELCCDLDPGAIIIAVEMLNGIY